MQSVSGGHPRPSQRYGGGEGSAARRVSADMDTNEELRLVSAEAGRSGSWEHDGSEAFRAAGSSASARGSGQVWLYVRLERLQGDSGEAEQCVVLSVFAGELVLLEMGRHVRMRHLLIQEYTLHMRDEKAHQYYCTLLCILRV